MVNTSCHVDNGSYSGFFITGVQEIKLGRNEDDNLEDNPVYNRVRHHPIVLRIPCNECTTSLDVRHMISLHQFPAPFYNLKFLTFQNCQFSQENYVELN